MSEVLTLVCQMNKRSFLPILMFTFLYNLYENNIKFQIVFIEKESLLSVLKNLNKYKFNVCLKSFLQRFGFVEKVLNINKIKSFA